MSDTELNLYDMWCGKKIVDFSLQLIDLRDEVAKPSRSLTAFFSEKLKDTNLKLVHIRVVGFKNVVSHFGKKYLKHFLTYKVSVDPYTNSILSD